MRILVTGGAGFIGSTIVDEYVKSGHRVWVIDNESTGNRKNVNPAAEYCRLDIEDVAKLKRFFQGKKFDVVNHHAAQIDVRKSVSDPAFDARVNILGIINVLNLCVKTKVRKFIFSASGGTAYGECVRPAREGDPEVPLSPYGVAKIASEKYIQAYAANYGMTYTIFRYSNVYGPRQDPHGEAGVVAIFSKLFLAGKCPAIFGTGAQTRDFVFVNDVARANRLALSKGHNQILNIGTGVETSVRQLFAVMAQITGFEGRPDFKPARLGELNRSFLNAAKAKKVLGWEPKDSLKSGLNQTIEFFK